MVDLEASLLGSRIWRVCLRAVIVLTARPPSWVLGTWLRRLTFRCLDTVFQFHALSSPQSPFPTTPTSRRALHRTLSDESIYSGQREHFFTSRASLLDQALPNDVLFSSTYPSLPKSLPLRRPSYTLGMKSLHGEFVFSCSWRALLMKAGSPGNNCHAVCSENDSWTKSW